MNLFQICLGELYSNLIDGNKRKKKKKSYPLNTDSCFVFLFATCYHKIKQKLALAVCVGCHTLKMVLILDNCRKHFIPGHRQKLAISCYSTQGTFPHFILFSFFSSMEPLTNYTQLQQRFLSPSQRLDAQSSLLVTLERKGFNADLRESPCWVTR